MRSVLFKRTGTPAITLAVAASTACGQAATANDTGFAVRDSAGIEIVENQRYAWEKDEGWSLADQPGLEIGITGGDPRYQLFRVTGSTRLPDGRIAVANSGTSEIRFYGPEGEFIASIGREGEGPGEFRRITSLWPFRGDSLIVWDEQLRRFGVIAPEGTVARHASTHLPLSNPTLHRPFSDGSLVLEDVVMARLSPGAESTSVHLTRSAPEGEFIDSIGTFPGLEMMMISVGSQRAVMPPLFAPHPGFATSKSFLFVGLAAESEILTFAPDGRLIRRIRWPEAERAVSSNLIEKHKAELLRGIAADEQQRAIALLNAVPFKDHLPAYGEIRVDRTGALWVERYPRPGTAGPAHWLVIDPEGRALGEVRVPENLQIHEIGKDYILGVARDEFGVERVRLYHLHKE